jgi:plasmid stabilization system protein ParE
MSYEIVYSSRAKQKFAQIAQYLAENGFDEAIIDKIRREIDKKLGEKPNTTGKLAESVPVEENGVRQINILHKNVIYYKVARQKVVILTIRAGRMDAKF